MSQKVLVVLTGHGQLGNTGKETGFYLSEVSHPVAVFDAAGIQVDYVSPKGGKAPMTGADREDPINAAFLNSPEKMAQVENTLRPDQVNADDYAAIFYAGGHGTMWDFPQAENLGAIAAQIYEKGGIVSAVCHGPAGLVPIRLSSGKPLVEGKTVSCFTNQEESAVELSEVVPFLLADKLTSLGATHTQASNFKAHVVESDRLITGQNPASAAGVGKAIVSRLQSS